MAVYKLLNDPALNFIAVSLSASLEFTIAKLIHKARPFILP